MITCNYPRIASTKTQSIFCNKTSFAKKRFRKDEYFMISNSRYLSFLETKIRFKTLNLWKKNKNKKVMKFHEKLSRKRWQVINFSPLSSQNSRKAFSNWNFSTDFTSDILKLTSRFKIRTLKLAFSQLQQWSNTKVKKIYKSKTNFTLVTRH